MGKIDKEMGWNMRRGGALKEFIAMLVNFSTLPSRKEEVVFQV